jgi:hypothetical protein
MGRIFLIAALLLMFVPASANASWVMTIADEGEAVLCPDQFKPAYVSDSEGKVLACMPTFHTDTPPPSAEEENSNPQGQPTNGPLEGPKFD